MPQEKGKTAQRNITNPIEKTMKEKGNDLGDLMGFPKPSSEAESSDSPESEVETPDTVKRDLGTLMELGVAVESVPPDNDFETSSLQQKKEDRTFSGALPLPPQEIDKRRLMSNKGPALWMLAPRQFPWILESFRAFKNKIAMMKENQNLGVFLLTGSSDSVGVSTVAINLGMVIGWDLPDKRVLLVDTNLKRPSLHSAFNLPPAPGLLDYLFGGLKLNDIIHPSAVSNLEVIPIGQASYQALSPFDLLEFSNFLTEVKNRYDFVLMDSAPALQSSQTRIISGKADGVIIVTEANKTRWEVISELKRQLDVSGARLVGSFLNKRRFVIPKWLYRFI